MTVDVVLQQVTQIRSCERRTSKPT